MKRFSPFLLLTAGFIMAALPGLQAASSLPSLTIVSPKSGLRTSNEVFLVEGHAADNLAVTNVLFSLNNRAWTNATTSTGWSNWTAQVTLQPGTNTFAACAVDSNGNRSQTNTARILYVLLAPLTVGISGPGVVSPNYDGASLQIGASYSMTAKATVKGFGLRSWTDGSNNLVTNAATLRFTMASNLVFTARFGDVTLPIVKALSATTNADNATRLTIAGTASDNVSVTNVLFSLNGGTWTNASSTNGWTNWIAQVDMTPGSNTVRLQAVDSTGNFSSIRTISSFFPVLSTLTVRTNGNGTVLPDYNGAQLKIGAGYAITGKSPLPGCGVQKWTDGQGNILAARTNTLKFIMSTNLELTAHFGDVTRPKVMVVSGATNSNGDPNSIIIFGTASDNVAVAGIQFTLNYGARQTNASTTNAWKNWSIVVNDLAPGINTISTYAVDTSGNESYSYTVKAQNNTEPPTLAGLQAVSDTGENPPLTLTFGGSTFSQSATDTNHLNGVNGVGSYTYTRSGGSAVLKLKYALPPSAVANGGAQTLSLSFLTNRSTAIYYEANSGRSGYLHFSPALTNAMNSVSNQLVFMADSQGGGFGTLFQGSQFSTQSLRDSGTNAGSYAYAVYSPSTALLKLSAGSSAQYIVARFNETNHGSYISETVGNTNLAGAAGPGYFVFSSQAPGGNAPATITNQAFKIISGTDSFNLAFGDTAYSQDTTSTNFDNAVGNYAYTPLTTNVGQMDLTVTAPPALAGSNNTARFIFVAPNAGLFTNEDTTFSAFLMRSITNLTPASITNTTMTFTDDEYHYTDTLRFAEDGTFNLDDNPAGTYSYTPYGPRGAMLYLNLNTTNFTPMTEWVQLNFTAAVLGTNSGTGSAHVYNTNSVQTDSFSGTFKLY